MTKSKIWALVINGMQARILRGLGNADTDDIIERSSKAQSSHLRDIMADQAGRSFSSYSGGRRSAMEPGSDPIRHDMQEFARETLQDLEKHHRAGDYEQLAIFSAPKMLGVLREELPEGLRSAVIIECPSNFINLPEGELRETVRRHVREEQLR
jgi:protein required for attachment to host cells